MTEYSPNFVFKQQPSDSMVSRKSDTGKGHIDFSVAGSRVFDQYQKASFFSSTVRKLSFWE